MPSPSAPTDPWAATASAPEAVSALNQATHGDPFAVLGRHAGPEGQPVVRCVLPGAQQVTVRGPQGEDWGTLLRLEGAVFAGAVKLPAGRRDYRLQIDEQAPFEDAYRFGPVLETEALTALAQGRHPALWTLLGAHACEHEGVTGMRFAVWAPHARRVSVVGDCVAWDGRRLPMRRRHEAGVWELFVPGLVPGQPYKYELLDARGAVSLKADPCGQATECPPATASVLPTPSQHVWQDADWLEARTMRDPRQAPIAIYEVHVGSWRRHADGRLWSWRELACGLLPYVAQMGFTHLELMPVAEHPFGGSWGYQPTALFAPSARYGSADDLRAFIDRAHALGLGVILDWVPAHFPDDAHGLADFDGTALYEYADPRVGRHAEWGTRIYDFGRPEVVQFLIANALYWLKEFHFDGLRVDAVASMLYLDYSRPADGWRPNIHGGRENLEAVAFLQRLNERVYAEVPGVVTIAEESTAWPGVSRPTWLGGLGFGFKWNMGWMNDTLAYFREDPVHRPWHHHRLTFGLLYAFAENFVLPLSHDEVVHGKGSLIRRMPGDDWQRFANLRAYLAFMWLQPGKKLLFMGSEFGQWNEWNHDRSLDWHLLDDPGQGGRHRGLQTCVADLNRLLRSRPALHQQDCEPPGFAWIDCQDASQSVLAWLRRGHRDQDCVLAISHFTPVPRHGYRVGVPWAGRWIERLNTDAEVYGGSGLGNLGGVEAEAVPWQGQPASVVLTLPPLAVLLLEPADASGAA